MGSHIFSMSSLFHFVADLWLLTTSGTRKTDKEVAGVDQEGMLELPWSYKR